MPVIPNNEKADMRGCVVLLDFCVLMLEMLGIDAATGSLDLYTCSLYRNF